MGVKIFFVTKTKEKKMKNNKISFLLFLIFIFVFAIPPLPSYAQTTPEAVEQREFKIIDRTEELLKKPETAEELIKMLKERAEMKLKEKRKALLKKTKWSTGVISGYETNPANDANDKNDFYVEEDFSFNWLPTFHNNISADVGYRFANQTYYEQTDLNTQDHTISASLKFYPFESGKLYLQPGIEHEWLWYTLDDTSTYEDTKAFIKFKHFTGKNWSTGGKYEYSYKDYNNKYARDENKNILQILRHDYRNTAELYVTRFLGKYSVKLRSKLYRNNSNDSYQKFYDFYSYRGYITLARSFLKDDKLYISFTSDFERKNYDRRVAVNTARNDNVMEYKFDAYYTVTKNWSLNYGLTHKESSSNAGAGEFNDTTHQLGLTLDF